MTISMSQQQLYQRLFHPAYNTAPQAPTLNEQAFPPLGMCGWIFFWMKNEHQ